MLPSYSEIFKPIYAESRLFIYDTTYISQVELGETGSAMAALWLKGHFDTMGMETWKRAICVCRTLHTLLHTFCKASAWKP